MILNQCLIGVFFHIVYYDLQAVGIAGEAFNLVTFKTFCFVESLLTLHFAHCLHFLSSIFQVTLDYGY